jgi:ABC-2 type transport system permease protein
MILMLICAMMTAISIVREKETGTMEVLLVSPVRPILIILAKAVPYFVLSCVNLATVLLLSVFVLGVPVAGSLVWLVLVSFLFVFVSLSLGLLVSTLTRSQVVAMLISGMSFMLPVVLLSGMMFPVEHMPRVLQMLSHMIPAKWFIIVVKDLMIKGAGISAALPEVLVLCGMAVVFVTLSLLNFKHRLE